MLASRRTALLYEPFMALVAFGRYPAVVRRALAALDLRPGERVLDLCCGTGLVTREVARLLGPGGSVAGIDASPPMLDIARSRRAGWAGPKSPRSVVSSGPEKPPVPQEPPAPRVSFVLADAARLPFTDGSFDAATIFLGLHEIAQSSRAPALAELWRVLRPGGRGLVLDFSATVPRRGRGLLRLALVGLEGAEAWTITDPGTPALLEQAGLRPKERRPVLGGVLEAVLFSRPAAP